MPIRDVIRRLHRPVRLSVLVLVVAGVCGAGGVVYLAAGPSVQVYVAALDLPPYHQIVETDLRTQTLAERDVADGAATDKDGLVGRYTLTALHQDEPFERGRLGPVLAAGRLDRLGLMALPSSPEVTVGGGVDRGDIVDILLSPIDAALVTRSARLAGVLVVDVTDRGGQPAVVLALTAADQRSLQEALGTSRVIVVRTRPYQRP